MTAVQKFKWFYKYFKNGIYGGRTSEKSIGWVIKDIYHIKERRKWYMNR